MNFTMEYYLLKYEELSVLSDTKKCRTSLMRNKDTGELVVKKEMGKESFSVYSLLKSIKNKNLIKVLECFRDEDKTIEIEEYVNGKRLDDYFREKKATLEQVVDVGIALCEGLAPMHKLNLVHRDIQPKNIIITNEGSLKIIDFDISRKENENATHDTTLLGTVGYAAPEQYGFAQTTNRSDIYSIGAVLKELSSFSELDKIIAKCMEMDPANRYENVEQLKNELEKIKDNGFGSGSYNDMEFGTENNNGESDELPKITLKYFIKTIPGFRRGNFIFMIIAIMMYGMILPCRLAERRSRHIGRAAIRSMRCRIPRCRLLVCRRYRPLDPVSPLDWSGTSRPRTIIHRASPVSRRGSVRVCVRQCVARALKPCLESRPERERMNCSSLCLAIPRTTRLPRTGFRPMREG